MESVSVFIRYNRHWDKNDIYIEGEIKGIWLPKEINYNGRIDIASILTYKKVIQN